MRLLEATYCVILALLMLLSFGFSRTAGFIVAIDRDGSAHHTSELLSSGSNDNLAVEVGVALFTVPLLFRIFRLRKRVVTAEVILFCLVWSYQLFLVITLDAGSFWQTIGHDGNWVLAGWLAAFALTLPAFVGLRQLPRADRLDL